MSFCLDKGEDPRKGLRRIAREELEATISALDLDAPDRDALNVAVHDSRKGLKKLRGLIRLFRESVGEKVYREENICLRDLGRELSDFRDAWVKVELADHLSESDDQFRKLHKELVRHYDAHVEREGGDLKEIRLRMLDELHGALKRVEKWPLESDDFDLFSGGLRKVYKRCRKGLKKALAHPTAEQLHEWRKRVKYLRSHMEILSEIWPEWTAFYLSELHRLTNLLGDDHDLVVLQQTVHEHFYKDLPEDHLASFRRTVDEKHEGFIHEAWPLGRRLFAERPEQFVERIRACWDATW